jgi:uracil-DNA glycosylase
MLDLMAKTPYDNVNYDEFKTTCLSCTNCDLHTTRTQVVVGHGPVPSLLMTIGEGPGEQEDLQGRPFVGKAGQLLTKIFESVGIERENEVYITNIVKCRPPQNRTPYPSESLACSPFLQRQLNLVQPKLLILLGAPALKTVLGDIGTISTVRGQWIKKPVSYMEDPLYIMPMFHPSYLLRNASKEKGSPKWLTWRDMQEVKTALDFYKTN